MRPPRGQAEGGGLQVGERAPRVAARQPDQVIGGLVVERDRAAEPARVGQRAADHLPHVVVGQRLQGEQQRPGQQRGHHGEERVLGGRADERHPAVLHRGQQRVLLGLGEPVHLVDEQHGLRAVHAQRAAGGVDRGAHVLDPGADRGKLHEATLGHLADHVGQRGLAGARRPPEQQRHRRVVVDQLAERRAGAGQVPLADHLVQGARPHPDGERRGRARRRFFRLVEQALGLARPPTLWPSSDPISARAGMLSTEEAIAARLSTGSDAAWQLSTGYRIVRLDRLAGTMSACQPNRAYDAWRPRLTPSPAVRAQELGIDPRDDAQPGTQRPLAAAAAGRVRRLLRGARPGDNALGRPAPRRSRCGPQPPDGGRAARPDRQAESGHHHHGPGVEASRRG